MMTVISQYWLYHKAKVRSTFSRPTSFPKGFQHFWDNQLTSNPHTTPHPSGSTQLHPHSLRVHEGGQRLIVLENERAIVTPLRRADGIKSAEKETPTAGER